MGQSYKSVYFKDGPQMASGRASLTLAFGPDDQHVFEAIRHLSSETLRNALGHRTLLSLKEDAQRQNKSINALCLSTLRNRLEASTNPRNAYLPGFEANNPVAFDPLQATFNGGRHEPLHEWYPFLEGYSPAFVESVIGKFCPDAKFVFDPFAGTGTTPLTASRLGMEALYAEINPILQFLIESKLLALRFGDSDRKTLVADLLKLADKLEIWLDEFRPDALLRKTYTATFGDSKFFDRHVFEDVLRCRSLIDNLQCGHPVTARFVTTAALRSLVPASRLIRRGDLRFKTDPELARGCVNLRKALRSALRAIALDIESLSPIERNPTLLLEDAKKLDRIPKLSFDTLITSPPYLNGTNYFRNTKIELWFLQCLKTKKDLAWFRSRSVTSGINDVTAQKSIGKIPPSAEPVVRRLEENSYDSRIPRMVASYATEMHALLQTLSFHMQTQGTIVIDIGDSAYAGVHVPTDQFIVESLHRAGFELREEQVLRQRYSRSQRKLTQKLLVFRPKNQTKAPRRPTFKRSKFWKESWSNFKENLPHQSGEFAKRNWGHPLHSLCSYQGKMKPSLAKHLVEIFTSPNDRILDPFAGVGTIPFEAALRGVESFGFDISPPAVQITAAKIGRCSAMECKKTVENLEEELQKKEVDPDQIKSAQTIRFNGPLTSYFHPQTLNEILIARNYFLHNPPSNASQSLVFSCLLHILHGNRPYALSRRSHPITPFAPSGDASFRALIPRLQDKLTRSLSAPIPEGFVYGHSVFQDATAWWPTHVDELDAIVTSPPFFNSTRFHMGNWMRLWFSGWEVSDFQQRPLAFVDELQKTSFDIYRPILRQCRERLKPGGVTVFHLGESKKCDMAKELARVARRWFRVADTFTECVSHCENHGIRDKGAVLSHQFLVLQ